MSIERISSNATMNLNLNLSISHEYSKKEFPKQNNGSYSEQFGWSPVKSSKENVEEIIEKMNSFIEPTHTSIQFKLHEGLKEYYVTIVDQKTEKVIREIPSKKILDIYAAMTEFLGLMVDKKI